MHRYLSRPCLCNNTDVRQEDSRVSIMSLSLIFEQSKDVRQ